MENNYEQFYSENIENQYYFDYKINNIYDENDTYINVNNEHRIDMTYLPVYSIDPENCQDVDDAFSYYENNNNKYICIHIADPTEHIPLYSDIFQKIITRAQTRYPSNREPLHMLDKDILEKSTLHENKYGIYKKAITITMEFDKHNNLCFDNTSLYFTYICVKMEHKLSYANIPKKYIDIQKCLELSNYLFPNMIYNQDKKIVINYSNERKPYLYETTEFENKYKVMIAKFAIFCNNYVAFILKHHLPSNHIIFRSCPAINNTELQEYNNSFCEFMKYILINNVSAQYDNNDSKHGMLQLDEYLHMTSPIRRSVDCIIHYLLKCIYLGIYIPFDENMISNIINQSNIVNKKHKKIQFRDYKFRFLHALEINRNMSQELTIQFYFTSFYNPYLNLIICKLNETPIHISYVIKTNPEKIKIPIFNVYHDCKIVNVNACSYYDEGSLPELDSYIQNIIY